MEMRAELELDEADQEQRYAFTLSVAETVPRRSLAAMSIIRQVEVDVETVGIELLSKRVHDWAVERLQADRADIGLYHAEFGTITEDDETAQCLAQSYVAWDGDKEIALAS